MQPVISSINNIGLYYYCENYQKKEMLIKLLFNISKGVDLSLVIVKGDGLCLLNSVCSSLYNIIHNDQDQYQDNVNNYCQNTTHLINKNFQNITNQLVSKMNTTIENAYFHSNLLPVQENYQFAQLGQILSTVLDTVVVSIEIIENDIAIIGVFPNGESLHFDSSISLEQIRDNVNTGIWRVVFVLSLGRHYNSLIPLLQSNNISQSHIDFFNLIYKDINWINF
jgi:hypothetical protein